MGRFRGAVTLSLGEIFLAMCVRLCTIVDVMTNIILNITPATAAAIALVDAVEAYTIADANFGIWSDDASEIRAAEHALDSAEQAVARVSGIVDREGGRALWRWAYAKAGVEPSPSVLM